MKLGILGAGMIVQEFLPLLDGLDLEGAALLAGPHSPDRAAALAERYGLEACCSDYDQLLRQVDIVYIALPNDLHFPFAKKALLHGKHVIVEKPACSSHRELEELAALAEKARRMLFEAVTTHHLPAHRAMKASLPKIGRPRLAILNFSQYSSRYDAFLAGDVKPAFDPAHCGGALMDLNVYNLHALLGLFGPPEAVHYTANVARGVDTSGVLTLDYPDFKAVCLAAKDCGGPNGMVIEGEAGVLQASEPVSLFSAFSLRLRDGTEERYAANTPEHRMVYEFRDFLTAIREEDFAARDALLAHSLSTARILDAARAQAGLVFPGGDAK